jgi:serine/threonine protein kinase
MEIPWNTAADIWSFGTVVCIFLITSLSTYLLTLSRCSKLISLIYGGSFNLFPSKVPRDHEEYELGVVMEMYRYFAPFPPSMIEIADEELINTLSYVIQQVPNEELNPFDRIREEEVPKKDSEFMMKIMKFDHRDRPTAKGLLVDKWWDGE